MHYSELFKTHKKKKNNFSVMSDFIFSVIKVHKSTFHFIKKNKWQFRGFLKTCNFFSRKIKMFNIFWAL